MGREGSPKENETPTEVRVEAIRQSIDKTLKSARSVIHDGLGLELEIDGGILIVGKDSVGLVSYADDEPSTVDLSRIKGKHSVLLAQPDSMHIYEVGKKNIFEITKKSRKKVDSRTIQRIERRISVVSAAVGQVLQTPSV